MYRSFTDRVFGGVCGGVASALRVNPWAVRIIFGLLTLLSAGAFATVYVMLWWVVPQESVLLRPTAGTAWLLLSFGLMAVVIGGWVARLYGWTFTPAGVDLFLPGLALLMSGVFFLRQIGRSA